jgi:serine protease Do
MRARIEPYGDDVMTEIGNADSTAGASVQKPRSCLRAFLLACVAGLGIAAALGGPIAYQEFAASDQAVPLASDATAARPVGFADVVAKVKPAVISVRVKIKGPAGGER